jgi:hypothetical protein
MMLFLLFLNAFGVGCCSGAQFDYNDIATLARTSAQHFNFSAVYIMCPSECLTDEMYGFKQQILQNRISLISNLSGKNFVNI